MSDLLDLLDDLPEAEIRERMVENWWKMRSMTINMGTLIENKMVELRLLTDDQRAIRPRKVRRLAAEKQEARQHG